ncbi:MAG: leucine--tRNA ligase, partial [Myxococcota bacterium]
LEGLEGLDWPNSTRTMQREWIGRSEGAEVTFAVEGQEDTLEIFTTRPDTLFGATFMVLAPEHPLVAKVTTAEEKDAVDAYVRAAKNRSDLERQQSKEKTGVATGGFALNPVNGARVPIWIADYVLMGYGTGAIMAVPAHDTRDFEFATEFGIPIVEVVSATGQPSPAPLTEAFTAHGVAVNSGRYDGMTTADMKAAIIRDLEAAGQGKGRVETKLRDWVFSRQRYWGEPIPIVFPVTTEGDPRRGDDCEIHFDRPQAVPEDELPVRLPELDDYAPGDDPAGVLARATDWRFFEKGGQWFARETNTMPQWAGSCWYYLRFCDPGNDEAAFSKAAVEAWLPVDLYVGGAEHAVLHLLYARFWHMVLYDAGLVPVAEPFQKLVHQGLIMGPLEYLLPAANEDEPLRSLPEGDVVKKGGDFVLASDGATRVIAKSRKMSKSLGNVVNPDDIVHSFGADALRVYEMFMGPLEASKPWNTESINGIKRFLDRCWRLATEATDATLDEATARTVHKAIRKVGGDIEALRFNTAISAMMVLSQELQKAGSPALGVETLAQLLHPFAPHLAEEMWELLGHAPSIQKVPWPDFDPALVVDDVVEVPVQVNGKKRGVVSLPKDADEATALEAARGVDKVAGELAKGTLRKTIWVPGRILNLIVK